MELLYDIETSQDYESVITNEELFNDIEKLFLDDLPEVENSKEAVGGVFISNDEYREFKNVVMSVVAGDRIAASRHMKRLFDILSQSGRARLV